MKERLFKALEPLSAALERFPFETVDAYADWLAQTFYYVRHSTRLLATAAGRFAIDEKGDALHHRFAAHMGEEKKHEKLLVHDLEAIGRSLATLPEHASTRMFYEPQYYKIEHEGPAALFGYILPLEAIAVKTGPREHKRVVAAYGASAASFVRLHAHEDPDHLEKAFAAIARLDERERDLVAENLEQTTFAYATMLADIRARLRAG